MTRESVEELNSRLGELQCLWLEFLHIRVPEASEDSFSEESTTVPEHLIRTFTLTAHCFCSCSRVFEQGKWGRGSAGDGLK